MLYAAYQALSDGLGPWQQAAGWLSQGLADGIGHLTVSCLRRVRHPGSCPCLPPPKSGFM